MATDWVDDDRKKSGYNIQKKRNLYLEYCVCVVKWSWRIKPSCWTSRRPTPMTTWKPRSTQSTWNPTMTWHTWWTRECARSCYSLLSTCSVCAVILIPCTHRTDQDVRVFVSSHPCMEWAFPVTSLISSSPPSSFSHSSSTSNSSCYPSTSPRLSSKSPCAASPRRVGSTDESFSNTQTEAAIDFACDQDRVLRERFPQVARSHREEVITTWAGRILRTETSGSRKTRTTKPRQHGLCQSGTSGSSS